MSTLITTPNVPNPDELYAELVAMAADVSAEEALNRAARLILVLANHIGDPAVVSHAIELAVKAEQAD